MKHTNRFDELMLELHGYKQDLVNQVEELRRAQEEIEISHKHYVQLYELAPVGIVLVSAEGVITDINLTGANLLRMDREKLIDTQFIQYIAEKCLDKWHQLCFQAKNSLSKQTCELLINQNDNSFFHAHVDCLYQNVVANSSPLHIVFTDITELKKSEEELRIAAATFEMHEGIIVTDAHKVIKRVNHAFSRITGYSSKEVIGSRASVLRSGLHDRAFYRNLWKEVARCGFWQGEIWYKRKDCELFPAWQTISAVVGEDTAVTHYVGSFTDITAQKQAEKVLFDARDRLEIQVVNTKEELEKIKGETADINTALNVLLKHRELDKTEAQLALSLEVEATVVPMLKNLKMASSGRHHTSKLIGILEDNLHQLVKCYGRAANLSAAYQKLTPVETKVASMIRQGLATKSISTALNIATGTVEIHRKHIRKKLGLDGKGHSLYSYLSSLSE